MSDPFEEPVEDDLDERLAAAAPKRLANRATYALLALVIAVAGFIGGTQVQKRYGTPEAASAAAPTGAAQFPGGGAGRASGAPGGGGRGGITGTVKLVDGTTVYIETPDGQTITVRTTGDTVVLVPGRLADLAVGSTVTVQGQNADGTVTATSVTRAR
ncbi:DUF5666 domain-containing protein [Virgisporangium ochraceum]|uniref:DUF5666 domain-containing protein n=1 Tax=Virgisporangium ochraceum TaxID=65505 RepID=A0A8J4EFG6_9ACTN|nr:DUF5666 domain-containing protein [Virgisporangium ochraceum]GIJ70062.1 hypothetical protein Voc01_049790 [Virgisporangium ochraceum]